MQLQGKFIVASIPAVTIALLLLGAIVYSQLLQAQQTSLEREISHAAERIDLRVESIVEEMRTNSGLLADAAPVVEWFSKSQSSFFTPRVRTEALTLLNQIRENRPDFRELRLVNYRGIEQLRVADKSLANSSNDETGTLWFSKVVSNPNADYHETIATHADDGATSITVSSPVHEKFGIHKTQRMVIGHVVIDIGADVIAKKLSNNVMGGNGYIAFFNKDLDIIYTPEAYSADTVALRTYLLSANRSFDIERDVEHIDIHDETLIIKQHIVRDGLIAIIVSPENALQSVKSEIATTVGLVTMAAIVSFSAFFSWLVHWIVVAPVSRLQSRVTELSEGRHVSTHQSTRNDEIGQLARSFTQMSEKLSLTMQQLQNTSLHNKKLAYQDGLTGLPNRRHFYEILNSNIDKAAASASSLAVMFIDLDKFKKLNDTEGHQAGDELLSTVAERLQQTFEQLRKDFAKTQPEITYHVARLAGDEFVVLLSDFTNQKFISTAANRLSTNLCRTATVGNIEWPLNASVGIALYPEHAKDGEKLLACADRAMYEVKRESHSNWCMYKPGMHNDPDFPNSGEAA